LTVPELTADLAGQAARYIARHLLSARLLVNTDRTGYELALALAQAVPDARVDLEVRATLDGLVQRSIDHGQQPPKGW
jgi:hypothetical protein